MITFLQIKKNQMDKQESLPSLTLYRRNCQASAQNYLAYLSSTTEITLLQFTKTNKICNSTIIKIPLEPVKALSIKLQDTNVYVAVAFLTKFTVFCGNVAVAQSSLKLDANIVSFQNPYVAICQNEDGFAFLTRKGQLALYNITTKVKCTLLPSQPAQSHYCSLAFSSSSYYFGTQNGKIKTVKPQGNTTYKEITIFDTTSTLPVFHIIGVERFGQVYCVTCEGELYILGKEGQSFGTVSLHRGMIVRMMVNGNTLYTVGEDQTLNKFEILGDQKVKLISSTQNQKLISILTAINGKPFISYYQTPILKQI